MTIPTDTDESNLTPLQQCLLFFIICCVAVAFMATRSQRNEGRRMRRRLSGTRSLSIAAGT